MKLLIRIFITVFVFSSCIVSAKTNAPQPSKSTQKSEETQTQKPKTPMPDLQTAQLAKKTKSLFMVPVRRVGINPVKTNINEFRSYMTDSAQEMKGLASLPYTESDLSLRLIDDFKEALDTTGRFWGLFLNDFQKQFSAAIGAQDMTDLANAVAIPQMKRLETDYGLDGWLDPLVYFTPNQTLVRLVLKSKTHDQKTLTREDMYISPQPSEDKIRTAFSELMTRMRSSLGHDGRVTFQKDNLLTVDFGKDAGVQRGDILYAGYVILSSIHPKTHEYLKARRIATHQLKVLDSRNGSSLCQILYVDRTLLNETQLKAEPNTNAPALLAWKKDLNTEGDKKWRDSMFDPNYKILDSTPSGFGQPLLPYEDKLTRKLPKKTTVATDSPKQSLEDIEVVEDKPKAPQAVIGDPLSYIAKQLRLGVGYSYGKFTDFDGESTTSPTLINSIMFNSSIDIDTALDIRLEPNAKIIIWNGKSDQNGNPSRVKFQGTNYNLGADLLYNVFKTPNSSQKFYTGFGFSYVDGTFAYDDDPPAVPISSTHFQSFEFSLMSKWEGNFLYFGHIDFTGGLSLVDLFHNNAAFLLKLQLQPFYVIPPELVFMTSYRLHPNSWGEFTLGLQWDFISTYTRFKKEKLN